VRAGIGEVYVQMFGIALASWYGARRGYASGPRPVSWPWPWNTPDLYSCDHLVESAYRLGTIRQTHLLDLVASGAGTVRPGPSATRCPATPGLRRLIRLSWPLPRGPACDRARRWPSQSLTNWPS
jgi:hypothetical protein